jgi:hypothetical protein
MTTIQRLVVSMALTLLALGLTREAAACSCRASGPPCQNFFQVDAVFVGTVQSISIVPEDQRRTRRVEFAMATGFRGVQGETATVFTPADGAACGYEFKQGERYVVYAYRTKDGSQLEVSRCSRTRLLAQAADDVAFLQDTSVAPAGANVSGLITHLERDLGTDEGHDYGPVSGVLVTVRGLTGTRDSYTDASGRYQVTGLTPGTYEIAVFPPAAFSATHLKQVVELRDVRACSVANFSMRYDGRISGTLMTSDGKPAEGARVDVMAAERVGTSGYIQTLNTTADANGRFELREVAPGRYVVGVDLVRRMDAETVYPTTFYSGTADATRANVLQMNGADNHDLGSMILPPERVSRQLVGTLRLEDGRPASDTTVSLWDGHAPWKQVAVGIRTDSEGAFSFLVHDGLSYVLNASSYSDPADGRKSAGFRTAPFVVSPHLKPLTIVLAPVR